MNLYKIKLSKDTIDFLHEISIFITIVAGSARNPKKIKDLDLLYDGYDISEFKFIKKTVSKYQKLLNIVTEFPGKYHFKDPDSGLMIDIMPDIDLLPEPTFTHISELRKNHSTITISDHLKLRKANPKDCPKPDINFGQKYKTLLYQYLKFLSTREGLQYSNLHTEYLNNIEKASLEIDKKRHSQVKVKHFGPSDKPVIQSDSPNELGDKSEDRSRKKKKKSCKNCNKDYMADIMWGHYGIPIYFPIRIQWVYNNGKLKFPIFIKDMEGCGCPVFFRRRWEIFKIAKNVYSKLLENELS